MYSGAFIQMMGGRKRRLLKRGIIGKGDRMLKFKECERDNLCVDCDDPDCLHAGDIGADCPKWVCDMPNECEQCLWIREYVAKVREYGN